MSDKQTLLKRLREAGYEDMLHEESADQIEKLEVEIAELQSKVNTVMLAAKYTTKIRDDRMEKLELALKHCIRAISEWERKPEDIEPYLLGALDSACKALEREDER